MRYDWILPSGLLAGITAIGFGIYQLWTFGDTAMFSGHFKIFGGFLILLIVCMVDWRIEEHYSSKVKSNG